MAKAYRSKVKAESSKGECERLKAPNIIELATRKQENYIYHLVEDICWFDRKRLFGFIRKRGFGNEKRYMPEMLRKDEASRLIEGLKGMKKRVKS